MLRVVVPSKGRADTIREHTLHLFPEATVVVDAAERDSYLEVVDEERLVTHPGLYPAGRIQNWMLDRWSKGAARDDVLVVVDDDVLELKAMPGWRPRSYHDPEVASAVVEGAAQCAIDAGCALFGFNQCEHPLFFRPHAPFRLNRWVGTVLGHVGDHGLRFDERSWCHGDADLSLQSLLRQRIVWCDERWAFVEIQQKNRGGNTAVRDAEAEVQERAYLKEKWGRFISFSTRSVDADRRRRGLQGTKLITSLRVPRRQA